MADADTVVVRAARARRAATASDHTRYLPGVVRVEVRSRELVAGADDGVVGRCCVAVIGRRFRGGR
jgi:hypothetical protein